MEEDAFETVSTLYPDKFQMVRTIKVKHANTMRKYVWIILQHENIGVTMAQNLKSVGEKIDGLSYIKKELWHRKKIPEGKSKGIIKWYKYLPLRSWRANLLKQRELLKIKD